MSIKEYCTKILELLLNVGENKWQHSFKNFIAELETREDTTTYRKIISIYGGAGSFNDLVLYREGRICMEENSELNRLRNGLYNKIAVKWS